MGCQTRFYNRKFRGTSKLITFENLRNISNFAPNQ